VERDGRYFSGVDVTVAGVLGPTKHALTGCRDGLGRGSTRASGRIIPRWTRSVVRPYSRVVIPLDLWPVNDPPIICTLTPAALAVTRDGLLPGLAKQADDVQQLADGLPVALHPSA
jgi:hypothetical protein